jgi:hypothetical protein
MYEYRTLKSVSHFKKGRRERGRGRTMEMMKQTGVQYMHIWKCHNETPCTTTIYNKNFLKSLQDPHLNTKSQVF